jgi:hypothetical protein
MVATILVDYTALLVYWAASVRKIVCFSLRPSTLGTAHRSEDHSNSNIGRLLPNLGALALRTGIALLTVAVVNVVNRHLNHSLIKTSNSLPFSS